MNSIFFSFHSSFYFVIYFVYISSGFGLCHAALRIPLSTTPNTSVVLRLHLIAKHGPSSYRRYPEYINLF